MKWIEYIFISIFILSCASPSTQTKTEDVRVVDPISVCFSPDEQCHKRLIEFIRGTKTSLSIAIFDITHHDILRAIIDVSKKLPVRVLVDKRQAGGAHSLVMEVAKAGIPVKVGRQPGLMHNKFTIRDGNAVETGSFNYTVGASEKNNENQLYIFDKSTVEKYTNRFDDLWREGKPFNSE